MKPIIRYSWILSIILFAACGSKQAVETRKDASLSLEDPATIRFASFNTSLVRSKAGELITDLETGDDAQAKKIAEIIQRTQPDIIAILEFDFDKKGKALELFKKNYLEVSQNEALPIKFPYGAAFPSNTGKPTGLDCNGDGKLGTPNDAFGYGAYEGQYAFAILSKYPLDQASIRTFQKFLWKDMPDANLPFQPKNQKPYYSQEVIDIFRLSSKNHIDLVAKVAGKDIHLLVSHPTPPVFDGPEDRNGKRNYDEIRLFADYISSQGNEYLYDDKGKKGGLQNNERFVIFGDLNADPLDGDSYGNAINQLLNHPLVNQDVAVGKFIPTSSGGTENTKSKEKLQSHKGKPDHDTSEWGLRVDYVLPSANLQATSSGIFWPAQAQEFASLTVPKSSSDHRLVWVDVTIQ